MSPVNYGHCILKTKQNKTRSLYVAQAGLKPPILLPSLPAPPPHAGVLDGHHQARQHHLLHSLQSPFLLRCIFPQPCSAHTDFTGGWLARHKLAAGDCWEAACHLLFGRTVYGIVFSSPISKPACQKPKPSMFLSILERGQHRVRHVHQFPRLEQASMCCSLTRRLAARQVSSRNEDCHHIITPAFC